ncbi:hypothetical protein [Galactobacter caseinivorans]|uniref:Uncharacterized protein n=1 Tax=Galactobacter caseinivorans TaxID=2676123 RepID=A0A496PHN9_9MICC|nr:hypothetical protein [Galactobacter caseinivorans]RKW69970.1 hypothetical protein DWQ67_10950 [Galactobacter caseinivorans]
MRELSQEAKAALVVLRELGWTGAAADVATLPLGDATQRRIVRAALSRNGWYQLGSEVEEPDENTLENTDILAMYAARLGLPGARVASLLLLPNQDPNASRPQEEVEQAWRVTADLMAARSPAAEADFLQGFWGDFGRSSTFGASRHAALILQRIHDSALDLPDTVEYTKDFWAHVGARLDAVGKVYPWDVVKEPLPEAVLRARFSEHVRLTGQLGVQVTGPFATAVVEAMRRGWVPRQEVLDAALVAMDTAVRPADRKVWTTLLSDDLVMTAPELQAHRDRIIASLSVGDAPVVEALGIPLILAVEDPDLPEALLAVTAAATLKARKAVVAALRKRSVPAGEVGRECVQILEPWGQEHAPVAVALESLRGAWGLLDDPEADPEPQDEESAEFAWPATPPLWSVPRTDFGEPTLAALSEVAASLLRGNHEVTDLATERFLSLANRMARVDPDQVRGLMRSLSWNREMEYRAGLEEVADWAASKSPNPDSDLDPLDFRRTVQVAGHLGLSPVILSEPSWDDLRVDLADLTARLEELQAAGMAAFEADLVLALTRLEPASDAPELRARLAALDLPLMAWDREVRSESRAAAVVLEYVDDPVQEVVLTPAHRREAWVWSGAEVPASLRSVTQRLKGAGSIVKQGTLAVYPSWGDAVGPAMAWLANEDPENVPAATWQQVARRKAPLTPGLAINLLSGLRRSDQGEREVHFDAAKLAWERGLLRPGVPSLEYIDWVGTPLRPGATATSWVDAAEDGLLPVLWPLLDQLCAWAAASSRMPRDLGEVAAAMRRLAPSVVSAVHSGAAEASDLAVPGLRALAARSGKSQAILAAREALKTLPDAPSVAVVPAVNAQRFAADWPEGIADPPVLEDGALISGVDAPWFISSSKSAMILDLPGDDHRYRVSANVAHRLGHDLSCRVDRLDPGSDGSQTDTYKDELGWDQESRRLLARQAWNRDELTDYSQGLCAIAVGTLAYPGEWGDGARRSVRNLVTEGFLGATRVQGAARLLFNPADGVAFHADSLSPARMAGSLAKLPGLLPALWPILTEAVRAASGQEKAPRWLNGVLDVALDLAPVLAEAARRGLMPADWPGLAELAARPGKSAALTKARALVEALA